MIALVLGGARSGKSAFAEAFVNKAGKPKLYIATCEPFDEEIRKRIAQHQEDRADAGWKTLEIPLDIADALHDSSFSDHAILVDCLTVWLGNIIHHRRDITESTDALVKTLATTSHNITLVSNEVGLGIVPDTPTARLFRDEAGRLNQKIAAKADLVVWMFAGIPTVIKGSFP